MSIGFIPVSCVSCGLLGRAVPSKCDLAPPCFVSSLRADLRVWWGEAHQLCLALCQTFNYEKFQTYRKVEEILQ